MGGIDLSDFLWPDAAHGRRPQVSRSLGEEYAGGSLFFPPLRNFTESGSIAVIGSSKGLAFSGSGFGGLFQAAEFTGYPYLYVGVWHFRDVSSNRVLASIGNTSSTGQRIQIDISSGNLRHIAVGSSTEVAQLSVSAGKWYNVIAIGRSATDRQLFVNEQTSLSSNTSTFSSIWDTCTTLCGANQTYPNGTQYIDADVALSFWSSAIISSDQGRKLADNPWQIFANPSIPFFSTASGAPTDVLTASSILASPAVVGTPAIGQTHALTSSSISSAPTVGAPAVSQRHVLTASGIAASSAVAQPSIAQRHALTASAISASVPVVGAPTLTEIIAGTLSALPVVAAPAVVGAPSITQNHALSAGAISAGPATFGTPTLAQQHALIAQRITSVAAAVGSPLLSEGGSVAFTRSPSGSGYRRASINTTRPKQINTKRH